MYTMKSTFLLQNEEEKKSMYKRKSKTRMERKEFVLYMLRKICQCLRVRPLSDCCIHIGVGGKTAKKGERKKCGVKKKCKKHRRENQCK